MIPNGRLKCKKEQDGNEEGSKSHGRLTQKGNLNRWREISKCKAIINETDKIF